jgi:flavin reductase (DIM6/NTAB) family NADH-FMN oxidoreductase RutF
MSESRARRTVLRQLTYGLYVATTVVDGGPTGASVSWLSQCSFDPPLVMLALRRDGLLARGIRASGRAMVHVPGAEQIDLVKRFFVSPEPDAQPPLHGRPFRLEDGLPVLEELPCRFGLRVRDRVERGDHDVLVAEIVDASGEPAGEAPLRMADTPWSYGG